MAKKKIKTKHNKSGMDAACNYLHMRIKQILPYIYSAIALALWNVLDESEEEKSNDIITLIVELQNIWTECINNNKNILEWCEEVTGINIKDSVDGTES